MKYIILYLMIFLIGNGQVTHWRKTSVWWKRTGTNLLLRVDDLSDSYYFYAKPDSIVTWNAVKNKPVIFPPDTTTPSLQTYVYNHSGGGMTPEVVSDSCDNVRYVIRDTIGVIDIDWSKIVNEPSCFTACSHEHNWIDIIGEPVSYPLSDSTTKIDTAYVPFQTYVSNHGGGIPASEVSDSCDNVRGTIRDTSTVVWKDSAVVKLGILAKARNALDSDSLGHYSPARFTDTTRYKACSVATHNRIVSDSTNAFELIARKGAANGYAGLGANSYVPTAQLGSGSASSSTYLRGDQTWATPVGGGSSDPPIYKKLEMQIIKNQALTTVSLVGIITPTLTITLANADNSDGRWLRHATTAVSGNPSGVISALFTIFRRDWEVEYITTIKTDPTAITSIRYWVGMFSASPDAIARGTGTIHLAAFSYDTGLDGTLFWRTATSGGVANTFTTTITTQSIAVNTN